MTQAEISKGDIKCFARLDVVKADEKELGVMVVDERTAHTQQKYAYTKKDDITDNKSIKNRKTLRNSLESIQSISNCYVNKSNGYSSTKVCSKVCNH